MSELIIALLLIVPIAIVIAILNHSHKKRKKKSFDRVSAYMHSHIREGEIVPSFQKQLVHQLVIIDEKNRKLVIIDHTNATLSHDVILLDEITSIKPFNHAITVQPDENSRKSESITSRTGVEITMEKTASKKFLVFYDHTEHSVYHMAELKNEAALLQQKITKIKNNEPAKVQ